MQQLTLHGHVGKDATVRDTNGSKAINFRLAVNETYQDKQGNKQEQTTWYSCTYWRGDNQSTRVAEFLKAGQGVVLQGRPKPHGYKDKDGNWVAEIEVRVERLELAGSKKVELVTVDAEDAQRDDDLPF